MCIRFIARIKIKIPESIPPRLRSGIGFIYKVGLGRRIPKIAEKRYVSAALENMSKAGAERSRGQVEHTCSFADTHNQQRFQLPINLRIKSI